jgi:uncharacterized protein involved in high-affinity Fe2+ transport
MTNRETITFIPWNDRSFETDDWLEFGKIIQGKFKALCIKKYEVDNGFEVFVFMPMVSYDAQRFGGRIQVEVPHGEIQYRVFAVFDIVKKKDSKLQKFSDYFRML